MPQAQHLRKDSCEAAATAQLCISLSGDLPSKALDTDTHTVQLTHPSAHSMLSSNSNSRPSLITLAAAKPSFHESFLGSSWRRPTRLRHPEVPGVQPLPPSRLLVPWLWLRTLLKTTGRVIGKAPLLTLVVPLLTLLLLLVAGEMGVWAAARNYTSDRQTLTDNTATNTAQELDFLLQSYITPVIAVSQLVAQTPYVPDLLKNADVWMASILNKLDTDHTSTQLQVLPWNIKAAIYPFTPSHVAAMANHEDLNTNSLFKDSVVWAAGQPPDFMDLLGPLPANPLNCPLPGFCAREVIWLPSSKPNETWGNEVSFTTSWAVNSSGPVLLGNATVNPAYRTEACGAGCSNYRSKPLPDGRSLVYWGFALHCVCISSLTRILDNLMLPGNNVLFKSVLQRKRDSSLFNPSLSGLNASSGIVIYESNTSLPRATELKNSCRDVGSRTNMELTWELCISPVDGFHPSWELGLQVMVAFTSFIIASLVFLLMLSQETHRMLVQAMLPPRALRSLKLGLKYAELYPCVTILFSDIVTYTSLSSELAPSALMDVLDSLYRGFDDLVDKHKLYKVGTIGDAFMCAGGAPVVCPPQDAAIRVANMALDMVAFTQSFETNCNRKIQIRVGIYSGPVTAAVMGHKMPVWCLVGDTVNMGSRMESNSKPMQIQVGQTTAELLQGCPQFSLEPRGVIDIKGKGPTNTFWLRKASQV